MNRFVKNRYIFFFLVAVLLISCTGVQINYGITGFDYWAMFRNEIPVNGLSFFDDLSMSNKERLDAAIKEHLNTMETAGKDTAECVVDFAELMPFEWDTLLYVDNYEPFTSEKPDELNEYVTKYNIGYGFEGLLVLSSGKIVCFVDLEMPSDEEKGMFFCTRKQLIKRARNNAKFHLQKQGRFFVLRDMSEEYVPAWRYVQ